MSRYIAVIIEAKLLRHFHAQGGLRFIGRALLISITQLPPRSHAPPLNRFIFPFSSDTMYESLDILG